MSQLLKVRNDCFAKIWPLTINLSLNLKPCYTTHLQVNNACSGKTREKYCKNRGDPVLTAAGDACVCVRCATGFEGARCNSCIDLTCAVLFFWQKFTLADAIESRLHPGLKLLHACDQ
jgi:hypothetical protein